MACDNIIIAPGLLWEDSCMGEEKTPRGQEAYLGVVINNGCNSLEESIELASNGLDYVMASRIEKLSSYPIGESSRKNVASVLSSSVISVTNDVFQSRDGIIPLKENALGNETEESTCDVSGGLEGQEQDFRAPMDIRCSKNFVEDARNYMLSVWVTNHDADYDESRRRRGVCGGYNSVRSKQRLLSLLEKYVSVENDKTHGSEEMCPFGSGEVCPLEDREVSCDRMSKGIDINQEHSMVSSGVCRSDSLEEECCSVGFFKKTSAECFKEISTFSVGADILVAEEGGRLSLSDIMEKEFTEDDCTHDVDATLGPWTKISGAYVESLKSLIDLDNLIGSRENEPLIGINVWGKYGCGLSDSTELESLCGGEQELFSPETGGSAHPTIADVTLGPVGGEIESIMCVD